MKNFSFIVMYDIEDNYICEFKNYKECANIVDIQQVLHQKSIATTRRYINNVTRNNNKLEYKVSDLILGGN